MLEVRAVTKRFVKHLDIAAKIVRRLGADIHEEVVQAVDNVDMSVARGEVVTAVAGFLYLSAYSPDQLKVLPITTISSGETFLKVADCNSAETVLEHQGEFSVAGWVGFSDDGSEQGKLPCSEIVVEKTTWGRIKGQYDNR